MFDKSSPHLRINCECRAGLAPRSFAGFHGHFEDVCPFFQGGQAGVDFFHGRETTFDFFQSVTRREPFHLVALNPAQDAPGAILGGVGSHESISSLGMFGQDRGYGQGVGHDGGCNGIVQWIGGRRYMEEAGQAYDLARKFAGPVRHVFELSTWAEFFFHACGIFLPLPVRCFVES